MTETENNNYFKAFIRVVKSINVDSYMNAFGRENIIKEPLIIAKDKDEVKRILLEKYPQFFQNNKIYERESKDSAQFFYVVIYPLFKSEIDIVVENKQWTCANCSQIHPNTYISRPIISHKLGGLMFCGNETTCFEDYKRNNPLGFDGDEIAYINSGSLNYIYKITEKTTSKCYVGKTKNAPFFRWWNHLTKSNSPFGLYLRQTKLSDWTFEVLIELPPETIDTDVFKIESQYINQFDSINNGYNTLISHKN